MRILHLSQFFSPEPGAVQVRAEAMARYLTEAGHQVTVLTEMPNHPKGVIFPEYRGKIFMRERVNGLDILRVWVSTSPEKNLQTRLSFYASYMLLAVLRGLFLRERYDVVFANSPPLLVGVAGAALSVLRRIPLVFEVQDLWPESAVEMGELTNPRIVRAATWTEELCYQRAEYIVIVSEGIRSRLLERGIPASKLAMVENGSNTELFRPQSEAGARLRMEWGFQDKFIVFYGGIIGLAQGLETVVETARLLVDHADIHFVMVGEGPRKEVIKSLLAEYRLPNFTLLPGQPLEAMPAHLSAVDVSLAPLRDLPVFHGVRPTKILDAWACQRPVILSGSGEACKMVEDAQGGLCTKPENPAELARAILTLYRDPETRKKYAINGYEFVRKYYSLRVLAQKLEGILVAAARGIDNID